LWKKEGKNDIFVCDQWILMKQSAKHLLLCFSFLKLQLLFKKLQIAGLV
jgi:hypothetical protein